MIKPVKHLFITFCLSFLLLSLLSGCSYRGYGEFYEEGCWPFKNYSLSLPEFEAKKGTIREFNLGNYKGNNHTVINLTFKSELQCWVILKTPPSKSRILLKIEDIEPGYDLKAFIRLASGWK